MKTFDPSRISFSAFVPVEGSWPNPSRALFQHHNRASANQTGTSVTTEDLELVMASEKEFFNCFSLRYVQVHGYVAANACYMNCSIGKDDTGFYLLAKGPTNPDNFPEEVKVSLVESEGKWFCDLTQLTEKTKEFYVDA